MSPTDFLPTAEQEAVISHGGSAFVIACPGAGKTRMLTERARRLLSDVSAGRGIAFLSFTQWAVSELRTRLRDDQILRTPEFPSFIGTFDSFVWQFLVAPFGVPGSDVRPRVIADLDKRQVTPYHGAQSLPLGCFSPTTGAIDETAARSEGFSTTHLRPGTRRAYETAATTLRAELLERGMLGFGDVRRVALERVADAEVGQRIGAALFGRFCEVIIDEAQDCNPDDLRIIAWLKDSGLTVKVVCDPQQSIYSFRGGVSDELMRFADTFVAADRKALSGNFRSAPNICKVTARLRPSTLGVAPDEPLGPHKADQTPVHILSYAGRGVPTWIGEAFDGIVKDAGIDSALAPVTAATIASAAAAAGRPAPTSSGHRSVRLAEAVVGFQFATDFTEIRAAIDKAHQVILELEGKLNEVTYRQYLAENEMEQASWRPRILLLLRLLRLDTSIHADAKSWHASTKTILANHLSLPERPTLSQRLMWSAELGSILAVAPKGQIMPRSIHSVKGLAFPAVCVVTTATTIGGIIGYLESGQPAESAEESRKLYVAATRAERLLAIAVPKRQTERLAAHLRGHGAIVQITEMPTAGK